MQQKKDHKSRQSATIYREIKITFPLIIPNFRVHDAMDHYSAQRYNVMKHYKKHKRLDTLTSMTEN